MSMENWHSGRYVFPPPLVHKYEECCSDALLVPLSNFWPHHHDLGNHCIFCYAVIPYDGMVLDAS